MSSVTLGVWSGIFGDTSFTYLGSTLLANGALLPLGVSSAAGSSRVKWSTCCSGSSDESDTNGG